MQSFATPKKVTARNSHSIATAGMSWQTQPPVVRQILRGPALQPKLTIGAPNDAYEREADRVADRVMRLSDAEVQATPAPPTLQRLCPDCEEELRTKPEGGGSNPSVPVPPVVHDVLRSPGKPLDAETRVFFEPRFGRDFGGVRIHSDAQATASAKAVNALAYTVGSDVVIGKEGASPGSVAGKRLLAHELTHVVEQSDRNRFVLKKKPRVQTKRVGAGELREIAVPLIVHDVLRSPGTPLDPTIRSFMEPRFGHDFGRVRIHADAAGMKSAAAIGARAYTSGHDVVFAAGQFRPETEEGRRLLAHELAHVAQQTSSSGHEASIGTQPRMIQKDDSEGPTAEEKEADHRYSEKLKDQIQDKYWGLVGKLAGLERTDRRQKWGDTLQNAAGKLDEIFAKESLSIWDVMPLHDVLTKIETEIDAENKVAYELWQRTNERYTSERIRLEEEGDYESELALKYLDQLFDEREPGISAIIAKGVLAQEDVLGFVYILDNRKHVETAKIVIAREREEAEAQLDRLSEVEEEGPGFLKTAWSIVGCDSVGECLGDVALTVATAGAGKALKFAVKGGKALKKASKARKVIRSAKQLGKRLHTFLEESKRLKKFFTVVKGAADDAAGTYAKWLKKDWKKLTSKISTDLISNYTTGEKEGATNVTTARINKDFIGTLVETELGIPKPDPKTIEAAIIFFLGKRHAVAASLVRTFILQSLKYRTIVNLAFESIRAGTPLTEADEIVKRTVISTIGEAAQDTVQAIPFVAESGLLKYVTEAIRKMVQRIFG